MEIYRELESILWQINAELPEQDRVSAEEISKVGHELNNMLTAATQQAGQHYQAPAHPRTLREKLVALWESIKAKINEWLCPVSTHWTRFLEAVRAKLQQFQFNPGNEKLMGIGLMAVGIALVAVLVKSMPLLIALLALLGVTSLVRLAERITRIPSMI